jgi:hypothetical protein
MSKFFNSFINSMNKMPSWGEAGKAMAPMGIGIGGATGGSRNVWNSTGLYKTGGGAALDTLSSLGSSLPGGAGAFAGGALGVAGNMVDLFGFNPEVSAIGNRYDQFSAPGFDLGDERSSTRNFVSDVRADANKKILGSAVSGAGAGAAFGPLGAGIGAVAGAVGGLFGKRSAVKKAKAAEQKMTNEYGTAIDTFNQAQTSYYGRENAQERAMAMQQARQAYGIPSSNPYLFL